MEDIAQQQNPKEWLQVVKDENVLALQPEDRIKRFDQWIDGENNRLLTAGYFDDPKNYQSFKTSELAERRRLSSSLAVSPSPDEVANDYANHLNTLQEVQRSFQAQKPSATDENVYREVVQGRRNAAFVNGKMVFNPAVTNDPETYRKAIAETDAPMDIKALYASRLADEQNNSAIVRRERLKNWVITGDAAKDVATALQESGDFLGMNLGNKQDIIKKNEKGEWTVPDSYYTDESKGMMERLVSKYAPTGDAPYKPLKGLNDYQKLYNLSDEQVVNDYKEAIAANAPASIKRIFLPQADSLEDYAPELNSKVRVLNKDVAPKVFVPNAEAVFDKESYDKTVDSADAPKEAKELAKASRDAIEKNIAVPLFNQLQNYRDDFREDYAKNAGGSVDEMAAAVSRYYRDKKDQAWYKDIGEFFGQAGTGIEQGAVNVATLPDQIAGMFGNEKAAERAAERSNYFQQLAQVDERVANRVGGSKAITFGREFATIVPDLVVQIGAGIATGGAFTAVEAGALAAKTGISKEAARVAIGAALSNEAKEGVIAAIARSGAQLGASTLDDVANAAIQSAKMLASKNPLTGAAGRQMVMQAGYAGLTGAGSTFSDVYAQLRESGMPADEAIKNARGAAITSGAITAALTYGFSAAGAGGVESSGQAGVRNAGEFTLRDFWNSGLGNIFTTQEGRRILQDTVKGFAKDAAHEGAEEGIDQFLQGVSQYLTNPTQEAWNKPMSEIASEAINAAFLGSVAGGASFGVRTFTEKTSGLTPEQMQLELQGVRALKAGEQQVQPSPEIQPIEIPSTPVEIPKSDAVQHAEDVVESLAGNETTQLTAAALEEFKSEVQKNDEEMPFVKPEDIAPVAENVAPQEAVVEPIQQQPIAGTKFYTERGDSEYTVLDSGATVRIKGKSGGIHEGDFGPKEPSVQTVYVTPEVAGYLGVIYTKSLEPGDKPGYEITDDGVRLTWYQGRDKDGKLVKHEKTYPASKTPEVGLHPVERMKGSRHIGSKITRIVAPTQAEKTQRKPVTQPTPEAQQLEQAFRKISGYNPQPRINQEQQAMVDRWMELSGKGSKITKSEKLEMDRIAPTVRSSMFESVNTESDEVVGVDLGGNEIKKSNGGTYYTVEDGKIKTGPSFAPQPKEQEVPVTPESLAAAFQNVTQPQPTQSNAAKTREIGQDDQPKYQAADEGKLPTAPSSRNLAPESGTEAQGKVAPYKPGEARKAGVSRRIKELGLESDNPESVSVALSNIESSKKSAPHQKRVAKDIKSLVQESGVKVKFESAGSGINGRFDPATNTVHINLDGPHEMGVDETILHEIVHAVGDNAISNPVSESQKAFAKSVKEQRAVAQKAARKLISKKLGKEAADWSADAQIEAAQQLNDPDFFDLVYGLSSDYEYHTHAMTSRAFQKFLSGITPEGKQISALKRFVNSVARLFTGNPVAEGSAAEKIYNELIGLTPEKGEVRDASMRLSRQRVEPQSFSRARQIAETQVNLYAPNLAITYDDEQLEPVELDPSSISISNKLTDGLSDNEIATLVERAAFASKTDNPISRDVIQNPGKIDFAQLSLQQKQAVIDDIKTVYDLAKSEGAIHTQFALGGLIGESNKRPDGVVSKFGNRARFTAGNESVDIAARNGRVVGPAVFSIARAYHGTPHKVEKFSLDKIGTGEGAQAYGWGLYFAESQAVGEEYRKRLTDYGTRNASHFESAKQWLIKKNREDLVREYPPDVYPELAEDLGWVPETSSGNLYTVTLDVNDEDLLDWDKPLSEQSEKVQKILKGALSRSEADRISDDALLAELGVTDEYNGAAIPELTGADAYRSLFKGKTESVFGNTKNAKAASELLNSLGIPGIRYLDGNSRGDGQGTYNYVIFDESKIKITEENGKPVKPSESFSLSRTYGEERVGLFDKAKALFTGRGLLPQEVYEAFRQQEQSKKAGGELTRFIGTDLRESVVKAFGKDADIEKEIRVFYHDGTSAKVTNQSFPSRKAAHEFAESRGYSDYAVATPNELMNVALGNNGPSLSASEREALDKIYNDGLDAIAEKTAEEEAAYMDSWAEVMESASENEVDVKKLDSLRERKAQWKRALELNRASTIEKLEQNRQNALQKLLEIRKDKTVKAQQKAIRLLPKDVAHQIGKARSVIDDYSRKIAGVEWLMGDGDLELVIKGKEGIYVTRSYEAFESANRKDYAAWLHEAYAAMMNPEAGIKYDPLAMERIAPLASELRKRIIQQRAQDIVAADRAKKVKVIQEELMADNQQVSMVGRSDSDFAEYMEAVAKKTLALRRKQERSNFINGMSKFLGMRGFASDIEDIVERNKALKKEAERVYKERESESDLISEYFGDGPGFQYAVMGDEAAEAIAEAEAYQSSQLGHPGEKIWPSLLTGTYHDSLNAALNGDFQEHLNFITGAPSSAGVLSAQQTKDWRILGDKILKHKNDVPEFLRVFWGEHQDTAMRITETISKQAFLLAHAEFTTEFAKLGLEQGFMVNDEEYKKGMNGKYKGWQSAYSSETRDYGYEQNPLRGLYMHPDIAGAIQEFHQANDPTSTAQKTWMKLVGASLWGATAGSVRGFVRNAMSVPAFMLNSGAIDILNPMNAKDYANRVILAMAITGQSLKANAGISQIQEIENKYLQSADKVWRGLLSGLALNKAVGKLSLFASSKAGKMELQGMKYPSADEREAFYVRAAQAGVANDNISKETIARVIDVEDKINRKPVDKRYSKYQKRLGLDKLDNFKEYLFTTMGRAVSSRTQLYGSADEYGKMLMLLKELDNEARIAAKDDAEYQFWKGENGLFENLPQENYDRAANTVTSVIQSYGHTWSLVNKMKKRGFSAYVGLFMGFRAEVFRTAFNTYKIAFDQIRNPRNSKEREIGIKRLAGALFSHIALTTVMGALYKWALRMFTGFEDDGDQEDTDALRSLLASWASNKQISFRKHKDGTVEWFDMSYTNPYSVFSEAFIAAKNEISDGDAEFRSYWSAFTSAADALVSPFASPQIAAEATSYALSGYDPVRGIKIWDETDSKTERFVKGAAYYLKSAGMTGDMKELDKLIKAANGVEERGTKYNMATQIFSIVTGTSVRTQSVDDLLQSKLKDLPIRMLTTKSPLYRSALRDSNDVNESDIIEDVAAAAEKERRILHDAMVQYRAAKSLMRNVPDGDKRIEAILRSEDLHISQDQERAIRTGVFPKMKLTDAMVEKIRNLGRKYKDNRLEVVRKAISQQ